LSFKREVLNQVQDDGVVISLSSFPRSPRSSFRRCLDTESSASTTKRYYL